MNLTSTAQTPSIDTIDNSCLSRSNIYKLAYLIGQQKEKNKVENAILNLIQETHPAKSIQQP